MSNSTSKSPVEWVYRQEGELYGPVSSEDILDKIRQGEIGIDVTVAHLGSDNFIAISQLDEFKHELDEATTHKTIIIDRESKKRQHSQKKLRLILALVFCGISVVGLGFWLVQLYVQYRQEQLLKETAQKKADELAKKAQAAAIAAQAEKLGLKESEDDIELELLPLVSLKKKLANQGKSSSQNQEEGTLGCQLGQDELRHTFRNAFPYIRACIRQEAAQNKNMAHMMTLSFTIHNDGSVISFESEDIAKGPLFDCLKTAIMALKYRQFSGERCNIDYPLMFGHKK